MYGLASKEETESRLRLGLVLNSGKLFFFLIFFFSFSPFHFSVTSLTHLISKFDLIIFGVIFSSDFLYLAFLDVNFVFRVLLLIASLRRQKV